MSESFCMYGMTWILYMLKSVRHVGCWTPTWSCGFAVFSHIQASSASPSVMQLLSHKHPVMILLMSRLCLSVFKMPSEQLRSRRRHCTSLPVEASQHACLHLRIRTFPSFLPSAHYEKFMVHVINGYRVSTFSLQLLLCFTESSESGSGTRYEKEGLLALNTRGQTGHRNILP